MLKKGHRVAQIKSKHYKEESTTRIKALEETFKAFQSTVAQEIPKTGEKNNNFKEIKKSINYLEQTQDGKTQWGMVFDKRLLSATLKSYFYDIIRYKEFHFHEPSNNWETIHKNGENINSYKHLAYIVKWLTVYKPVILVAPKGVKKLYDKETLSSLRQLILDVNFHFLFTYVCRELAISNFKSQENKDQKTKENPSEVENVTGKLRYQLRYRPYNEGAFEIIFELMQKAYAPDAWAKEKRHAEITPPPQK